MPRIWPTILSTFLVFAFGATLAHAADVSIETRKAAVLTTMSEAVLAIASLIQDRHKDKVERLSWSAKYSERDWVLTVKGAIKGETIEFSTTGYLWGDDKENWLVNYSGWGGAAKEELRINGKALWHYDKKSSDHVAMDFHQVVRFVEASTWGWLVGSANIFGGAIGDGAAIATAGSAKDGLASGAATWIRAGGAAAGSSALIGASDVVKSLARSDRPVHPPQAPKRPVVPKTGQKLSPEKGTIYTAVARDGRISASGPDGVLLVSGTSDGSTASGTIRAFDR